MITVRDGEPGGGKTLSAVGEDILPALRDRRRVVTNVELEVDAISLQLGFNVEPYVFVKRYDDQGAEYFSKAEHFAREEAWRSDGETGKGPLIVIDEAQRVLRVPGFVGKADEAVANWFTVHRHKGCDVTLVTPKFGTIPAAIRGTVARRFWYRKLGMIGLGGWYMRKSFVGEAKEAVRTNMGRYPREWFGLYRSVDADVIESLPKEKNVLLNWKLIAAAVCVLGVIVLFLNSGVHQIGFRPSNPKPHAAASPAAEPGPQVAGSTSTPADGPRVVSKGPFGTQQVVEPSQELLNLQDQIAILRLRQELDALKFKRPSHDELDGMSAKISGYMMVNGQASYFLEVARGDGPAKVVQADDLVQYGFKVTAIDRCSAYLRGDRGTYRLTCDVPARFGKPQDEFLPGRIQMPQFASSSAVEQPDTTTKPVPASAGRLAP